MKVVILDKEEAMKVGGIVTFNKRLMEHMSLRGHEVHILRFAQKPIRQKNIYRLPYYLAEKRSFIILPHEKTLTVIRKYLQKLKPDIVYTNIGLSPLDFLLPRLCFELRIPLAGVWHADFNQEHNAYQILAKSLFLLFLPVCRQLNLLHVFTQKMAHFYIRKGIDPKKITVIPNGVNPKVYAPGASLFAKEHSVRRGILFLGRLTLQKNPEVLIQSFLRSSAIRDSHLILVGQGEEEETLREKYQDPHVIFTGSILAEKKKVDIIRSCQIFVLPSRFEGMPLALLEAMSTGLACVVSDAGSNSETLGDAGIVLPSSKIKQQLPVVLDILLRQPTFTKILGKQARNKVLEEFTQTVIFDKLIDTFRHTISQYDKTRLSTPQPLLTTFTIQQLKRLWKKALDLRVDF
ncbi:glycosyltransferase family 4 protein [Candidatus Gottesmanbacteria bacterium]|nr:glycosyltransferase family 4 protein [Candidatus Gottesmanbacteria bacterium]